MWTQKIFDFFCDAFRPPFRTAPWIVLAYVVLSAVYNPGSNFNMWVLPDTDDYTRFIQVFNLLDGQDWFDFTLPRLYPDHPIAMHWSRLPDLLLSGFLAFFMAINNFFQLGILRADYAMLTAFLVPSLLLILLLHLVCENARVLIGRSNFGVTAYIVPLCLLLIFQFMPMRVDHHAYILLSAGTAFYCLQGILLGRRPFLMAFTGALALSMGLWNGAEILPMLGASGIALTAIMLVKGRRYFAVGAVFGFSLLAATSIILPIAIAPEKYTQITFDSFSIFYVYIAAAAAAYFALLYLVSRLVTQPMIMGALAVFLSISTLAIFLRFFPAFVLGPYAMANPLLDTLFFPNIREATPFYKAWAELGQVFGQTPRQAIGGGLYYLMTRLFVPLVGMLACLYGLSYKRFSRRQRHLWMLYGFFCLGFTLLAFFWQIRIFTYAQLFAIAPFTWLMLRYLKGLSTRYHGRSLYGWEIITILSFTIFPVVLVPAIVSQSKLMPDVMFYLGRSSELPCNNRKPIIERLQDLKYEHEGPVTIMAPMDYTPEFMFHTDQNFISAPYHRNDRGIIDMTSFFRSRPNDETATSIAKRLNLDYVVVCKASLYQLTLGKVNEIKGLSFDKKLNKIVPTMSEDEAKNASLGALLIKEIPPRWLTPVPNSADEDFILYKVNKTLLR
jgi:hypothetical protein